MGLNYSKAFENKRIKSIILRHTLDAPNIIRRPIDCAYYNVTFSKEDESIIDIIYEPKKDEDNEDTPPVVIMFWPLTLDKDFFKPVIAETIRRTQSANPVILVFSSEEEERSVKLEPHLKRREWYYDEASCDFWAKRCMIITNHTIAKFIGEKLMNELVALAFCLLNPKEERVKFLKDPTVAFVHLILAKIERESTEKPTKPCSKLS